MLLFLKIVCKVLLFNGLKLFILYKPQILIINLNFYTMNYYQERKLSMFWSMEQFLVGTSPEILDEIPNFTVLFKQFQDKVAVLNVLSGSQALQRQGNIEEKGAVKEDLCVLAADIAGKIMAYAINSNNYQLRREVNYPKSLLMRNADTRCVTNCTIILEKGNAFLGDLATYGITEVVLTDFREMIYLYDSTIPKPKAGVVAKKAATDALRVEFREATILLDKMQLLTKVVEFSQFPFFVDFKNTKRLTKPSYRTLSAIGDVVDAEGNGLALVTMECKELGFLRKVSENGGFRLRNMPDGVYPFVFSRPAYVSKVVEMVFYSGVRYEVRVVMERVV
ncbi:carboxypeptidase-like regulatory domain-containing protein [Flavobacterium sp. RSB2_4_14]|uniref:carboxypeptidase-like regulatory domain-containing protein n=1 Tax=Flavobacterium sp. RSB2_4_14 TaxID=3447665 RepID=UPI003F418354